MIPLTNIGFSKASMNQTLVRNQQIRWVLVTTERLNGKLQMHSCCVVQYISLGLHRIALQDHPQVKRKAFPVSFFQGSRQGRKNSICLNQFPSLIFVVRECYIILVHSTFTTKVPGWQTALRSPIDINSRPTSSPGQITTSRVDWCALGMLIPRHVSIW